MCVLTQSTNKKVIIATVETILESPFLLLQVDCWQKTFCCLQKGLSEVILSESQCGFLSNRSTMDMIFTLQQLQEKAVE